MLLLNVDIRSLETVKRCYLEDRAHDLAGYFDLVFAGGNVAGALAQESLFYKSMDPGASVGSGAGWLISVLFPYFDCCRAQARKLYGAATIFEMCSCHLYSSRGI